MTRALFLTLIVLSLCACNQGSSPTSVGTGEDAPSDAGGPAIGGGFDPLDEFFREGAGTIDGDVTLNGLVETDPNYDTSPYVVTQPAKAGDIAIFRVKGKLTDGASTTLYTKQSSPSKNYSSFSVPGNFVDQYKAMFVTNTEPLSITFYNANNYNTPVNAKAAIYDYNFKTQAAQNAGEPNDDENSATITDRSSANNINLGTTATRSVFSFDAANKDTEEWYKTTVSAGEEISFQFTTVSGRFGTWSFTMKLFDPAGVQLGGTTNIAAGAGTAQIVRTAPSTGTYYLQLVGTPLTRNNTNLYYNLYTITACVRPQINILQTPTGGHCPGSTFFAQVGATNTPTTFAWNFGGGAVPNTASSQGVTATFGAPGDYIGTVTVSNACGSVSEEFEYTVGCTGGVGQLGGVNANTRIADLQVEPDGTTLVLGDFVGTVDLDPGPGSYVSQSEVEVLFIARLDPLGNLIGSPEVIGGGEGTWIVPEGFDYSPAHGYRVIGRYSGAVDFRSGFYSEMRDSAVDGGTFILASTGIEGFQWVGTCSSSLQNQRVAIDSVTGNVYFSAAYSGTVDVNPTRSTFNPPVFGQSDGLIAMLQPDGNFINAVGIGGTGNDYMLTLDAQDEALVAAGGFGGTVDLDPGTGTANHTSTGMIAGFVLQLQADSDLGYVRSRAFSNTTAGEVTLVRNLVIAPDGGLRIVGEFTGTTDLNPGQAGFVTSAGGVDGLVLLLNSDWDFIGSSALGGPLTDRAGHVAVDPVRQTTCVYGCWSGTVDFDRGPGSDIRTVTGEEDLYLIQYNAEGGQVVTSTWGGTLTETPKGVGVDQAGLVRTGGRFFSPLLDGDPGAGVFTLSLLGEQDSFVERILPAGGW